MKNIKRDMIKIIFNLHFYFVVPLILFKKESTYKYSDNRKRRSKSRHRYVACLTQIHFLFNTDAFHLMEEAILNIFLFVIIMEKSSGNSGKSENNMKVEK